LKNVHVFLLVGRAVLFSVQLSLVLSNCWLGISRNIWSVENNAIRGLFWGVLQEITS